ncbi:hypothetical protein [Mycolicibacterium komossense]|uniref:Uncharacterized protein n=1 Tax=Mycolicibacterium komossense TaxID=1779 RepID=A0ABT3C9F5_9MYCO|nr:hypothetical protein [Mycolicibacterium komossense]MCV7226088.1 hypothetical protein [Mycolicibacterium komossense]
MKRPIVVRQSEAGPNANNVGDYWFTVSSGNGETTLTSKMYRERWRANRAARAFIASIGDTPVTFTRWEGYTPVQEAEALALGRKPRGKLTHVTERIRHRGFVSTQITRTQ